MRALDEETREGKLERVDRVVLLDEAPGPPPAAGKETLSGGSQAKFAAQFWFERVRRRPKLILFDFVGLARGLSLPLPAPSAPYSVFCHGIELTRATKGTPHYRALSGADRLIANSQTTAKYIADEFPEFAERTRVATLCIDPWMTERWEANAGDAPARFETREERRAAPVVLIISRMWSYERGKGHDELLEAWPEGRDAVPAAEFWIVGEGDDVPRLKAKVRELGIEDAVRFLGRVSDDELAKCYRRASLFAMPSRQEGFGLVYAEAMWHGVPCLASASDAGAEVVRDGEAGRVVPYGDVPAIRDALVSLLSDPDRLDLLGDAARRDAVERFGYERFKRDLLLAMGLRENEN